MNSPKPTDPGPFQKYLFSAACYVQVGQCYAEMLKNWDLIRRTTESEQLRDHLTAIWQEALERHLAIGGALIAASDNRQEGVFDANMQAIREQAEATGREAMQVLIHALSQEQEVAPDFVSFFRAWAGACETAYAELIRSEAFALFLAEMINSAISRFAGESGR